MKYEKLLNTHYQSSKITDHRVVIHFLLNNINSISFEDDNYPLLLFHKNSLSLHVLDERRPHIEFVFINDKDIYNSLRILFANKHIVYISPEHLINTLPTSAIYSLVDQALADGNSHDFRYFSKMLRKK